MKLVLASSNQGKLEELRGLLADTGIELVAQSDLGVEDADETGTTFVENALIKARHASLQTGLPALADDSGICVDALHGVPGEQRGAHFYCVLVLLRHAHDPQPLIVEGEWQGRILHERRGAGGHGYDPVFFDPPSGQSAAEMPLDEKNRISHRGKALAALKQRLLAAL